MQITLERLCIMNEEAASKKSRGQGVCSVVAYPHLQEAQNLVLWLGLSAKVAPGLFHAKGDAAIFSCL